LSEKVIRVAAALEATADQTRQVMRVQLRDAHGGVHTIEIPAGVLGALLVALHSQASRLGPNRFGQPMTLTSGNAFATADGRVGLELVMENAVRLPVLFPREAIETLREALDELERFAGTPPQAPSRH